MTLHTLLRRRPQSALFTIAHHVDGLAPGHYDVQVLYPQGIVGANGGDNHGNDTAAMSDVVVKPNRSADGIDFILIGL